METEIYKLIKEYVFKPLIGHICSKLWHCLQKRLLNYINAIKAKRRKRGVGKHAPLFFHPTSIKSNNVGALTSISASYRYERPSFQ